MNFNSLEQWQKIGYLEDEGLFFKSYSFFWNKFFLQFIIL